MSAIQHHSWNDFKTDLKPVWCPGCGDFGVVNSLYRALSELGLAPHDTVLISGIGCSSRLPGYVEAYGLNSLHGRALPIATGVKLASPELTVLAVGGDGDGLAIGGNHFIHAARRNVDITYVMMDNEIYGLTKGQAAPTTPTGDTTKSTLYGNPEPSVDPCAFAIAMGATWVGRAFSGDIKGTNELMKAAIRHSGFAFLNVISPCVTWRGDEQTKELRAKLQPVPTDHEATDREAALRLTGSKATLIAGVLYEVCLPTLLERMTSIRTRAGNATREEMLAGFRPAVG